MIITALEMNAASFWPAVDDLLRVNAPPPVTLAGRERC